MRACTHEWRNAWAYQSRSGWRLSAPTLAGASTAGTRRRVSITLTAARPAGSDRPDNLVAACATCNGLKRDNPLPAAVRDEAKVTAFIRADLIQRMADEARAGSKRASSRRIIPIMERDYR